MGPDGAIYIADWYNPIIQHGEVDFRDPRRDHTRGRIWRVTAKGRPLVQRPQLVGATIDALLEAAQGPRRLDAAAGEARAEGARRGRRWFPSWRAGSRALDPQGPRVRTSSPRSALDLPGRRRRRAGVAQGRFFDSKDARVRAAATRVVPFWKTRLADPRSLLAERVIDEEPRVRLEAVRGLAQIPEPGRRRAWPCRRSIVRSTRSSNTGSG